MDRNSRGFPIRRRIAALGHRPTRRIPLATVAVFALSAAGALAGPAYQDLILADPGLISYWQFEDPASRNLDPARDSNGGANPGVYQQSVALKPGALGDGGLAAVFAGGSGSRAIEISNEPPFDLTTCFSIETWIKVDSLDTSGQAVITKGSSWGICRDSINNQLAFIAQGTSDLKNTTPIHDGRWHHVVAVYDADNGRKALYVDGQEELRKPNPGIPVVPNNSKVWIGGNADVTSKTFSGRIDETSIYDRALSAVEVHARYRAAGGLWEDFDATAGQLSGQWYTGGGMNATRLRSGGLAAEGAFALASDGSADRPDAALNVYGSDANANTSMAWGPFFRVEDASASLSLKVAGGNYAFNEGSQQYGGAGVGLWDLEANALVPGRFASGNNTAAYQSRTISLAGLAGRVVAPVLVDRQTGNCGWAGVDSISAPFGAVTPIDDLAHHAVYVDYGFDQQADMMGWRQVDAEGNPVATTSFQIGRGADPNDPLLGQARHINAKGAFTAGEGFVTSCAAGNPDLPMGLLQSPAFTLHGDIIEFYLAGGGGEGLAFELWVDVYGDGSYTRQRASSHQPTLPGSADLDLGFHYDFWSIRDLGGRSAYLLLRDESQGEAGWISLDAVRMVGFLGHAPEPSAVVLWAIGVAGLALLMRWRARRRA